MYIPTDVKNIIFSHLSDDFDTLLYLWTYKVPELKHFNLTNLNWKNISKKIDLPSNFYCDFFEKLNWDIIADLHMEDFDFMNKYKKYISWEYVSRNKYLSENFIYEFENLLDWDLLSLYCDLPYVILKSRENKINWCYIKYNQNIPIYFLKHFLKHQFIRQSMIMPGTQ